MGKIHLLEGYYVHDLRERAFVYDDWRETEKATPLVYAGCHFIDLLRWISGEEITEVQALSGNIAFPRYPQADTVICSLRFGSGALGQVIVAFASAGPQDHSVRVYGTERAINNNLVFTSGGALERTLHHPRLLHREVFRSDRLEPRRLLDQLQLNIPAVAAHGLFSLLRTIAPRPNYAYGTAQYPLRLYEHGVACVAAIQDFVDAVTSGRRPQCTATEAARTVLACLAGNASLESGRREPVLSLEALQ
jgi:predicted dehydrogenase